MLQKANKSTSSTRKLLDAIKIFLSTLDLSCNLAKRASVFVTSAVCKVRRITYSCVAISATRFSALLFVASAACIAKRDTYSCVALSVYGAAVRRLGATCYVLFHGSFSLRRCCSSPQRFAWRNVLRTYSCVAILTRFPALHLPSRLITPSGIFSSGSTQAHRFGGGDYVSVCCCRCACEGWHS
jgi:hypothetical protein